MDDRHFDDLARRVAVGSTRRRFLHGVAGSLAAGAIALVGGRHGTAASEPVAVGRRTGNPDYPCVSLQLPPVAADRLRGRPGFVVCDAGVALDPATCACACTGGDCVPGPCPSGQTACGGQCVNLQSDVSNCGACDHPCSANETCNGGVCACGTFTNGCPTGYSCCVTDCVCEVGSGQPLIVGGGTCSFATGTHCPAGTTSCGTAASPCGPVCCPGATVCNPDTGTCIYA